MLLQARKNQKLFVTARQEEILIGSILGDAYITKRGQIQFEQSQKQKEYLLWKHKELDSISYKGVSRVERFDKRFNKTNISYRFWTRQYFLTWREKFYIDSIKSIPKDIRLSPLTLAIWYMDDGCYSDHKCIIATDGFNIEDILFLQKLLLDNFDIKSSIKNESKILIKKESVSTLFSLINPYLLSSMKHKFLTP